MSAKRPFVWTIRNFESYIGEPGEYLRSPIFSTTANNDNNAFWRLILYPRSAVEENSAYLALFVQLVSSSCDEHEIKAKFKLSLLNVQNEEVCITFAKVRNFYFNSIYGFNRFVKYKTLKKASNILLPDGRLRILCQVTTPETDDSASVCFSNVTDDEPVLRLVEDVSTLLQSEEFSDITLCVQNKEYPAHKSILTVRSPYFYDSLKCRSLNTLNITEIDTQVFEEILQFIYTGKTDKARIMPRELLIAANKFQLEDLKIICAQYLCDNLSFDNAVEMAIFATHYKVHRLKRKAVEFIKIHFANEQSTDIACNLSSFLDRFDGY